MLSYSVLDANVVDVEKRRNPSKHYVSSGGARRSPRAGGARVRRERSGAGGAVILRELSSLWEVNCRTWGGARFAALRLVSSRRGDGERCGVSRPVLSGLCSFSAVKLHTDFFRGTERRLARFSRRTRRSGSLSCLLPSSFHTLLLTERRRRVADDLPGLRGAVWRWLCLREFTADSLPVCIVRKHIFPSFSGSDSPGF